MHFWFFLVPTENILLEENKDLNDLKIIDFGMSTFHKRGIDEPLATLHGSPYYISPQVRQYIFVSLSLFLSLCLVSNARRKR